MVGFMPRIGAGVVGGLIGGVVFGMLMQLMDMIGAVAIPVGQRVSRGRLTGAPGDLGVHRGNVRGLVRSLGEQARDLRAAWRALRVGWWVIGALLRMPAKHGMNDMIFHVGNTQSRSLMGLVIYGLPTGLTVALLAPRLAAAAGSHAPR